MSTELSIPLDLPDIEILEIKQNKRGDYIITVESTLDSTACRQCGRKLTHCIGHELELETELRDQSYRPGGYTNFYIYEPKRRLVSAAPFRDRVVHHALCHIIEPIWEARFIPTSFACRVGKGIPDNQNTNVGFRCVVSAPGVISASQVR